MSPKSTDPIRCGWCTSDPLYIDYHDEEWGVPVRDAQGLFERLILEGMQAGLSWLTVLKKRAHMQTQFHGFDIHKLAVCGPTDVEAWLGDAGLIRHRGKLEAMIGNARLAADDPDFAAMLWAFAPPRRRRFRRLSEVPAHTPESQAMSRGLKKAGYRFVGPTICYAFMQSVGMVNDHPTSCFRHEDCASLPRPEREARA